MLDAPKKLTSVLLNRFLLRTALNQSFLAHRAVWLVLGTVFITLTLTNVVRAQVGGGHMVFGDFKVTEVKDNESKPQVFNVILYSLFGSVVARQSVSNNGRYQFYDVRNGEYDIVVELESQEVARVHFVLTYSSKSDFRYDISLEWRATNGTERKAVTVSAIDMYNRVQPNKGRYEKAEKAFENKKYDEATTLFQQIVADDPADFQAWSEFGTVYLAEKKTNNAETAYLRALDARPTFFLALMNLGKLRLATKNYEMAIEPLSQAVKARPTSADAQYYLGEAYLQIKKGSKAVVYLNEALKLDPLGMAEAHLRLAALYNGAGLKDKAAAEYEQFLTKKPDYPDRKKLEQYITANKKN
ncbi:MAG: tetratricopeptide repeat protein [bacterium]